MLQTYSQSLLNLASAWKQKHVEKRGVESYTASFKKLAANLEQVLYYVNIIYLNSSKVPKPKLLLSHCKYTFVIVFMGIV